MIFRRMAGLLVYWLVSVGAMCVAVAGEPGQEAPAEGPDLIMTGADIARLKWNIENVEWAKEYFEGMKAEVGAWRGREPEIPKRGGGWGHNYVAPDTGRRLQYDRTSPHRHLEPESGKFYEGELLDAAWRGATHQNNIGLALKAALLYRLTDEEWYAEFARAVLVRYAKAYHTYPPQGGPAGLGRIGAQALDEAVWNIQACSALDLLSGTPALSGADRKNILGKLIVPAAKHVGMYPFGVHNIQVWESVSMLMAGLLAEDADLVRTASGSLRENIDKGIRKEGMWFETSVGYHFYASRPFETLAAVCRTRGLALCDSPNLESMFTAMSGLAMPDGSMPSLNDGGRGYASALNLRPLVAARYAFDDASLDPAIAFLGRETAWKDPDLSVFMYYTAPVEEPAEGAPPEESVHMPDAGITVLRRDGRYALLKYNPPSGGHDHADRLGIIYYAGGRELFPDRGTTGYGHPLYKTWFKKTEAHNTIVVDGQQQNKNSCRSLEFRDERDFAGASARCPGLYAGVDAMRAVVLAGGAMIDVMRVESDGEHTFDWMLHGQAPGAPVEGGIEGVSQNPEISLSSVETAPGSRTVSWPAGDEKQAGMRTTLLLSEGDSLYSGAATGFFADVKFPVLMWRKKGKSAVYAAVTTGEGAETPVIGIDGDIVKIKAGKIEIAINTVSGTIGRE